MSNERDYWTIKAMDLYGGSFVKALGRCAQAADSDNLAKIKRYFGSYWKEYEKEGVRMEQRHQKEVVQNV